MDKVTLIEYDRIYKNFIEGNIFMIMMNTISASSKLANLTAIGVICVPMRLNNW